MLRCIECGRETSGRARDWIALLSDDAVGGRDATVLTYCPGCASQFKAASFVYPRSIFASVNNATERHLSAAETSEQAARGHDEAAQHWDSVGDERRAELERLRSALEREEARRERNRAALGARRLAGSWRFLESPS